MNKVRQKTKQVSFGRDVCARVCFLLVVAALLGRAVYLQFSIHDMLRAEGDNLHIRNQILPSYRGTILDREGEILAVSVPGAAAFADPSVMDDIDAASREIAGQLNLDYPALRDKLNKRKDKQFVYIKRQLNEDEVERLRNLSIEGLHLRNEYRRVYPLREETSHLLGVTDIDGVGIEGIEKVLNSHLQGQPGRKRVLLNRYERIINEEMKIVPQPGKDLALSIDKRIQYYAYSALKKALHKHRADVGAVVVMDARSGEILAIANLPSFNPNVRSGYTAQNRRNRALTDEFEPGSTIKPFIAAALLDHQYMDLDEKIQTAPGYYEAHGKEIRDILNYGELTLAEVIIKSSNVGISKAIAGSKEEERQGLSKEEAWNYLRRLGFGRMSGTSFPGEAEGYLRNYLEWGQTDKVIMSYGYGLSVSAVQLASAYAAIANDGRMPQVTLFKTPAEGVYGEQVMQADTARALRGVLERVVREGTGKEAQVSGFTIAGKTGTTRKIKNHDYVDEYISLFAGFAPASEPRIVAVVVLDNPTSGEYYGGRVAAPVFSEVAWQALRILNVPGDDIPEDVPSDAPSDNIQYTMGNR